MDLNGLPVVFILIFVVFMQVIYSEKCLLNNCQCSTTRITCDNIGGPRPIFTHNEKRYVRTIFLSERQMKWFESQCTTFPNIELVFYGKHSPLLEGINCPTTSKCPRLQTRCL